MVLNFQDPQNYDPSTTVGKGYDLTPATTIQFDVRSPNAAVAQFGVGGCVTPFIPLPLFWTTKTIALNTLGNSPSGGGTCVPDLTNVHLLFAVSVSAIYTPNGGTVLLDNIRFTPAPARQKSDPLALSLPVGGETFGVLSAQHLPIPTDQVNKNLASIREAALSVLALLQRAQPQDVTHALKIADALEYALFHDNHGDPNSHQTAVGGWMLLGIGGIAVWIAQRILRWRHRFSEQSTSARIGPGRGRQAGRFLVRN